MTPAAIATALVLGTETDLVELNDFAVNTIRDYCREKGYNARRLVDEEAARIDAENLNLAGYLKARRIGSRFLLSRKLRRYVFAAIMTRRALRAA